MDSVKLIYFEGCPEAKNARAALLTSGISDFEVIEQGELEDGNPLKHYSSPTILQNDEIIYGNKLSEGSSACSFQKIDPEEIKAKLYSSSKNYQQGNGKKGGIIGAVASAGSGLLVGFCPACIPALGAFLSSIGLGFAVQESVLKPLLIAMLVAANLGFLWGYLKRHDVIWPLVIGVIASVGMFLGRYIYISSQVNMILMYGTIPVLVGAAMWNLYLGNKAKKLKSCSACH